MKFKITTKKTISNGEAQKRWKARQSRRRILAIILVVIILMFLMILRPSVIRKKHLRSYGAEIGHLSPAENFCLAFPVLIH
jgi:heme/copper-type cytochrome/quinol oxidase subunit 2